MQGAHGHVDPVGSAEPLAQHCRRLWNAYDEALESVDAAIESLAAAGPLLDPVASVG